jgi:hypothetical protein
VNNHAGLSMPHLWISFLRMEQSFWGGPYADYTGLLVIVEAHHEEEVYELFREDPFVVNELVRISSIHEWLIFLDTRHKQQPARMLNKSATTTHSSRRLRVGQPS